MITRERVAGCGHLNYWVVLYYTNQAKLEQHQSFQLRHCYRRFFDDFWVTHHEKYTRLEIFGLRPDNDLGTLISSNDNNCIVSSFNASIFLNILPRNLPRYFLSWSREQYSRFLHPDLCLSSLTIEDVLDRGQG